MTLIKIFMMLPEVKRYAAEFGAEVDDDSFETNNKQAWFLYSVDQEGVGLIKFNIQTSVMCEFHPYIFREYKGHYGQMVQEFFEWFVNDAPEQMVKLNAVIPTIFKGALAAANRAGMTQEGTDRLSYLSKNGPCDRILLGITREEMK